MGTRGPKAKPDALKKLEGNPGKRALKKDAPEPEGLPVRPLYLTKYAREVWDKILNSMPPALYRTCDSFLLAAYCTAADMHRRAVTEIEKQGAIAFGENDAPYQNPWVSILNKQAQLMATLGSRLGLDPSARASLSVQKEDGKKKSKFDGLINVGKSKGTKK